MSTQVFQIGVKPTKEQLEELQIDVENSYSNYSQDGSNFKAPSYDLSALSDSILNTNFTAPTTAHQSSEGSNLLQSMKNSSDTVSKGLNDVAKAISDSNQINARSLQSIENMGKNITQAITAVTQILGMGNQLKDIQNKLFNAHSNIQSEKNLKQIDELEFSSQGHENLTNSQGEKIIPREANAVKNAEQALEGKVSNSINWNTVLDGVKQANEEMNEESINLFEQLSQLHQLNPESIKRIDDEVKNIYGGES
jgi:hypothetical protein